ncbi:hypothetical protein MRX96_013348 [Rhipicephalus microplus]
MPRTWTFTAIFPWTLAMTSTHTSVPRGSPFMAMSQIASTAMAEIMIKWIRSFARLLDQAASTSTVGKKPQAMFEACVADHATDPSDVNRFLRFLSELHLSWPEQPPVVPSALGVLINLALNWRDTFWLTLRVEVRNNTPGQKIRKKRVLITPGNEDALAIFARNHFHVQRHNAYLDYWMMHFKVLYGNRTKPLTDKEIPRKRLVTNDGRESPSIAR